MVHPAELRDGLVALINEDHGVGGEIIKQCGRRLARQAPREVTRVVFDAVAIAGLLHHLHVKAGALMDSVGFKQLSLLLELAPPPFELAQNARDRLLAAVGRHHVMRSRVKRQAREGLANWAEKRIYLRQRFHLVAPHLDPIGVVLVSRVDVNRVAPNAERPAMKVQVVALVLDLDEAAQDFLPRNLLPLLQEQQHSVIGFGRTEAVNAGNAGDNHAVAPLEKRPRRRHSKLVELIVDGRFFLDVRIACGKIGLRLVIIVVADKIFRGVVGEKIAELVVKLRR